ncbi:MAG: hypothetical protein HS111_32000 [Kofleriaceae bacterium]|nr:hypothetical protein [Kofleriaceae bacterium]MCL4228669.1 hypothetical protein [Myxococcales bacterium]
MSGRALALALALAVATGGCVVRYVVGPRLTGTCDGACDHYARCKGGVDKAVARACRDECPDVFGDKESLMAFESLSCEHTIDYVEGPARRPPGSPPPTGDQARQ